MVSSCGIPWLLLHLILLESACWNNALFCRVNGFHAGIVGKMKIGSPSTGYSRSIHPTRIINTQMSRFRYIMIAVPPPAALAIVVAALIIPSAPIPPQTSYWDPYPI